LKQHYPFETFRNGAEEALEKAEAAFANGKKFVKIDAPTGSGKSAYAIACGRKYNACVLTPTKILQEQYCNTKEFAKEFVVKGKSNYRCGIPGLSHYSVAESICVSDKIADESRAMVPFGFSKGGNLKPARALKMACAQQNICPYYTKIYNIGKVPGAVLNYDLFFSLKKYPGQQWGTDMGDTIVFDEAHQLLDKVREHFGYKFSNIAARRLLSDNSGKRLRNEPAIEWLRRVHGLAVVRMAVEQDSKRASQYDSFIKKVGMLLEQELEDERKFFVEDNEIEFEIKPLDIRYLNKKIFYPFKRVLFLSATFPANFLEIFGIDKNDCEDISVSSSFPKENRPILFCKDLPKFNKDTVLQKSTINIKLLDTILAAHQHEKGIIHTGNYKFMKQLQDIYKGDPRFLWVSQDKDKNEMMDKHLSSERPTILVSPAMMEGVDLKDDAARFGVVLKVPYPMLDDYTKRMMGIFPNWYDVLVATNICQSYGRQVRTETDWARFYIIDGAFNICLSKSKDCYSRYFTEALKIGTVNDLIVALKEESSKKS
jgi:ATP-dependent DNA helicase DinG